MFIKRAIVFSLSSLFASLCLAKSPFVGDIGKVYEFHDKYSANGNTYTYNHHHNHNHNHNQHYKPNNDWYGKSDCLNDRYTSSDFMTSNGTKCYVREMPQSDVKTYFKSKPDGSFGAGFSWDLD